MDNRARKAFSLYASVYWDRKRLLHKEAVLRNLVEHMTAEQAVAYAKAVEAFNRKQAEADRYEEH